MYFSKTLHNCFIINKKSLCAGHAKKFLCNLYTTYKLKETLSIYWLFADRFFFLRKNHKKYYTNMTNQSQDITEKHRKRQLPLLKWKQTFRDTVSQYPQKRKNITQQAFALVKTCWRCLQCNNFSSSKTSWKPLQDIFQMSRQTKSCYASLWAKQTTVLWSH